MVTGACRLPSPGLVARCVPGGGTSEALVDGMRRGVSKQPAGLADVGEGVPDVPGAEAAVTRDGLTHSGEQAGNLIANQHEQLVEGRALSAPDVEYLVERGGASCRRSAYVSLHHVGLEAEVTARLAISRS